jgi:hypothetical protein
MGKSLKAKLAQGGIEGKLADKGWRFNLIAIKKRAKRARSVAVALSGQAPKNARLAVQSTLARNDILTS